MTKQISIFLPNTKGKDEVGKGNLLIGGYDTVKYAKKDSPINWIPIKNIQGHGEHWSMKLKNCKLKNYPGLFLEGSKILGISTTTEKLVFPQEDFLRLK